VFCTSFEVREEDIDALGHVSNVSYVRWVQDVARAHSEAVGYGHAAYLTLGMVFVVRRHEIEYLRPSYARERVKLITWIESWSAATSLRATRVVREGDGIELVRAATIWALVSTDRGRPCRIPMQLRDAFAVEMPA
jgi:acyl-CoA thioester hydrolase